MANLQAFSILYCNKVLFVLLSNLDFIYGGCLWHSFGAAVSRKRRTGEFLNLTRPSALIKGYLSRT